MNKTILFFLTFAPTVLFGQKTKKITDKESRESFHVLKSDQSIRHGEYKKFGYRYKLFVKGHYTLGHKDGLWECFDLDGKNTLKYDYTKNELVFYKPDEKVKAKKFKVLTGSNSLDTTLTRPPIYLGGDYLISSDLGRNIRYPADARRYGAEGKVKVLFTVDKFGKTDNFHVEAPLGYGLDEEAIRVLKRFPDNWLPGLLNGQPVDVEFVIPVSFRLE